MDILISTIQFFSSFFPFISLYFSLFVSGSGGSFVVRLMMMMKALMEGKLGGLSLNLRSSCHSKLDLLKPRFVFGFSLHDIIMIKIIRSERTRTQMAELGSVQSILKRKM